MCWYQVGFIESVGLLHGNAALAERLGGRVRGRCEFMVGVYVLYWVGLFWGLIFGGSGPGNAVILLVESL